MLDSGHALKIRRQAPGGSRSEVVAPAPISIIDFSKNNGELAVWLNWSSCCRWTISIGIVAVSSSLIGKDKAVQCSPAEAAAAYHWGKLPWTGTASTSQLPGCKN
jgi:hypothetical protein